MPGVPHTLTGKRIEVPVKRLLQGTALDKAVNPGSVDNLDCCTSTRTWPREQADPAGRLTTVRPRPRHLVKAAATERCQCPRLR